MVYLIFVVTFGIILFSSVTNQIFSYRKLLTVHQLVQQRVESIEGFLYEISQKRENSNLPAQMIQECKEHIELSIRCSTKFHFAKSEFFRNLPPKLRTKLV